MCIPVCTRAHPPGQTYPSMHWGGQPPRQRPPWADTPQADTSWADPPGQTITAADGTYPTGMHSCYLLKVQFIIISKYPDGSVLEHIAQVVVSDRSTNEAQNIPILSVNYTDFKSGKAACFTTTCSEVDLAPEVILRAF